MPSAQWMALGCYRKLVSDHAVKPPKKVLLLNPSCHVPSPTMSIPGLQRLFLSQYPCLNTLFPQIPGSKYSLGQQVYLFWVPPWSATLCPYSFPSATSHTQSLDIFLIAHYTFPGFYLPKSESLSLTSGPAAFFGKKKTHISYFPVFLLLTHLFSFLQIKDILVFQSKASESYEQNNLFSPSIFLRKAWNILMQRFSWRQKLAWKNSSQTARVWLSYK